jgi:Yip1 domain
MIGGINPWSAMWTSPRSTIRSIVNVNPGYGVFYLAWIYALQAYFFYASYWSFGLSFSFFPILLAGLVLAPFLGWVWVYFTGWILHLTGKWLSGQAPMAHLRAAAAWSRLPAAISLAMWLILMIGGRNFVFIHGVSGPSTLFINFILLILSVWSFVLLILSVQEVQGFSVLRSFLNVCLAGLISWVVSFLAFLLSRYVYLNV